MLFAVSASAGTNDQYLSLSSEISSHLHKQYEQCQKTHLHQLSTLILLTQVPLFPSKVPSSYSTQSYRLSFSLSDIQTHASAWKNWQSNILPWHFGCLAQNKSL